MNGLASCTYYFLCWGGGGGQRTAGKRGEDVGIRKDGTSREHDYGTKHVWDFQNVH
jgi:hypothetical protein